MHYGVTITTCGMCTYMYAVASFPVPRPAFRRLQYGTKLYRTKQRRKAGRGTGYEAMYTVRDTVIIINFL